MTRMLQSEQQEVERREFDLTIFACSAILVLAAGLAVLMYPEVFASRTPSLSRAPQVAFVGFCALSCLLIAYIVDRQLTIQRLRRQMALDRRRASEELRQASADLWEAVPNFNTFDDRLSMEFRRAAAMQRALSVFIIAIKLRPEFSQSSLAICVLGDAAKEVSRKLRDEDSIYVLSFGFLGVILPGVDTSAASRITSRFAVSLSDASGPSDRFDFEIYSLNYPEHAESLHDLERLVRGYLPENETRPGVLNEDPLVISE